MTIEQKINVCLRAKDSLNMVDWYLCTNIRQAIMLELNFKPDLDLELGLETFNKLEKIQKYFPEFNFENIYRICEENYLTLPKNEYVWWSKKSICDHKSCVVQAARAIVFRKQVLDALIIDLQK